MASLVDRIDEINGRRVMVVGDVGLDEYVEGEVRRISPEAPVPVLEVESEDRRLGLSAYVAQNIQSLGGVPVLVSAVGEDKTASDLESMLAEVGVSETHLLRDASRPTTRKLRMMSGQYHIVRVDYEKRRLLSVEMQKKLLAQVEKLMANVDLVIIQDYAKGVMSEEVIQGIIKHAHAAGKKVFVDPHRATPLSFYRGADLFKPNFDEAVILTGLQVDSLHQKGDVIKQLIQKLTQELGSENIVLTQGSEGMTFYSGGQMDHAPTQAQEVYDVTGAGDTVIASLGLAFAAGWSLQDSCHLANQAAGLVVAKLGCVPCELGELKASLAASPS